MPPLDQYVETAPVPMPGRPNFDLLEQQRSAPDRPQGKATIEPSELYFDDMESLRDLLITDTKGALCENLPVAGQIPVLEGGGDPLGCNYTDEQHDSLTYQIYDDHKDQTVKFYGDGLPGTGTKVQGSGVMVGKDGNDCQILTALHVIENGAAGQSYPNMLLITTDGTQFPVQTVDADRPHELAVVTVDMGESADALCKPVTVAEDSQLAPWDDAISLGYPGSSTSLYASPGQFLATRKRSEIGAQTVALSDFFPGEDTERPLIELKGLALPGDSGGPTFNTNGELIGVVDRSTLNYTFWSTPVTEEMIDGMTQ